MTITIGSNIPSLKAQRHLDKATDKISQISGRLSSGQRINSAADDAAGLSVSSILNVKSRLFTQAIRNVNDALSLSAVAEGALRSLLDITIRQQELAAQAANGTYCQKQRQAMNAEANALVNEYNRIVQSTEYNGFKLLDPQSSQLQIQIGATATDVLRMNLTDDLDRSVGDGTYQAATSLLVNGSYSTTIAIADVTGDGKQDVVSAGYDSILMVLPGNGDGTFQPEQDYYAGFQTGMSSLVVADVNGDGALDVVANDNTAHRKVVVFLNSGDGTFAAPQSYNSYAGRVNRVAVGDLNKDNCLDIVAVEDTNNLSIFMGNGNGTFNAAQGYMPGGASTSSVTLEDFNGDQNLDLATLDLTNNNVLVSFGLGNGTFASANTYSLGASAGPASVRSGDLNGDGNPDLVATLAGVGRIGVLLGNSDGSFGATKRYSTLAGPGLNSLSLTDLNGDGILDVAAAAWDDSKISILTGNGDGTFQQAQAYLAADTGAYGLAVGDLQNDGRMEIITGHNSINETLSFFTPNGNYTSTTPHLNICTQSGARAAMSVLNDTMARIENQLSSIGAATSRFTHAVSNLQTMRENCSAAASRILDADVAQEAAEMDRLQIVRQAAVAVLTQANQQPSLVQQLI